MGQVANAQQLHGSDIGIVVTGYDANNPEHDANDLLQNEADDVMELVTGAVSREEISHMNY